MARTPIDKNSRLYLSAKVQGARNMILTILLFTIVNLVLRVAGTDMYFLYSASIPYYMTLICIFLDNGWPTRDISNVDLHLGKFAAIALVISAIILAVYLVCWLISKKNNVGLTVAMILFALDVLALGVLLALLVRNNLVDNMTPWIIDALIHLLIGRNLVNGVAAAAKLKKLPAEPVTVPTEPQRPTASPEF